MNAHVEESMEVAIASKFEKEYYYKIMDERS